MHYLIYFNSTHSKLDGSWICYVFLSYIEFIGILISYICLTFILYLMVRTKAYHFNIRAIWICIAVEYYVQLTTRTAQIFLTLNSEENGEVFFATSFVRGICYFVVSLLLPAVIAERLCASYFLSDYEHRSRGYISLIILLSVTCVSVILSQVYHRVESTLILHIGVLTINIVAAFINQLIERYNYQKLRESTNLSKGRKEYSLAERFQISENIRTCMMLKAVINCVAVFNLVSTITVSLDNFSLPTSFTNLSATVFNYCVLTYGSVIQFVMFKHTGPWRDEARRVLTRLRVSSSVGPPRPLRSTIGGAELVVRGEAQTDEYFAQLHRDWNRKPR